MAEFCLDCWNRLNKRKLKKNQVVLSEELDLCEGCGEMKYVIDEIVKFDLCRSCFAAFFGENFLK